MKRLSSRSGKTLQLSKETVRGLVSSELQQVAAGAQCPSITGCSSNKTPTLNQCNTIFCSLTQY